MKILKLIVLVPVALLAIGSVIAQSLLKYVDPNIGTAHSRWFFYTPAAVPGGMAKLGPSTNAHYGNNQGWEAVGYDTRQNSIEGFAHFHEWQVGGVSFMPTTGPLKVKSRQQNQKKKNQKQKTHQEQETKHTLTGRTRLPNRDTTKFCWMTTVL